MIPGTDHGEITRTQPDWSASHGDESPIRERIESLATAIRHKDADQVSGHYLPDVVVQDLTEPLDVRGRDGYRKKFERWFAAMAGDIHYELLDSHVSVGDDQAFTQCLCQVTGARTDGGRVDYRVRVDSRWHDVDGQWFIAHEHISMPILM